MNALKIVGRRADPSTPQAWHARAARQYWAAIELSPYPRPRGFVFKARTWAEWERWKAAQENPWLW